MSSHPNATSNDEVNHGVRKTLSTVGLSHENHPRLIFWGCLQSSWSVLTIGVFDFPCFIGSWDGLLSAANKN